MSKKKKSKTQHSSIPRIEPSALQPKRNIAESYNIIHPDKMETTAKTKMYLSQAAEKSGNPVKFLENQKNKVIKLTKHYNDRLIKEGVGYSLNDLKQMNIIDACSLFPKPVSDDIAPDVKITPAIKEYITTAGWLAYMPCFNEGVLRINLCRYIYWKILNVDIDTQTYTVALKDHMLDSKHNMWSIGCQACSDVILPDKTKPNQFYIKPNNSYINEENDVYDPKTDYLNISIDVLYRMLDMKKDLHWVKQDREFWQNTVINYAQANTEEIARVGKTLPYIELTKMFISILACVNYNLSCHKPSRPKHKPTKTITENTVIKTENKPTPERIIRTVGTMQIQSEKPPKIPTEKSIVKYSIASWPTRGFIRHYKSGKTVYVKPSVHHRKCLQKDDNAETKQTIIFKNNNPKTERNDT